MNNFSANDTSYVDYRDIIASVNQIDLWNQFLIENGCPSVDMGIYFCNPLRHDTHPGVWLSRCRNNPDLIVLNDLSYKRFHGISVFDAVSISKHLDFQRACQYVYHNYLRKAQLYQGELIKSNRIKPKTDQFKFLLSYDSRSWELRDKQYWGDRYGITRSQLEEDNTSAVYRYIKNGRKEPEQFKSFIPDDICYAFNFQKHKKLYRPLAPLPYLKWIADTGVEDIGGIQDLRSDSKLVIQKSYKDYRVKKNLGYNTIWTQGEGMLLPDKLFIKFAKEYKDIPVFFDNDLAGINAAEIFCAYGNDVSGTSSYRPVTIPVGMPKNVSDYYEKYGFEETRYLVKELL